MNWIETKALLDKVAERLFQKYVNQLHEVGLDFHDPYSLDAIHPDAKIFLGEPTHDPYYDYHFEQDKKDAEDTYHRTKTVTDFVDSILNEYKIGIEPEGDEYKRICKQTLEMLYHLDNYKAGYKRSLMPLGSASAIINPSLETNSVNSPSTMNLKELISKYRSVKINIEKAWKSERTIKGHNESLERIIEIFEVVTGDANYPIAEMNKKHARQVREILSIIPANLKKKYPTLSMNQIILECQEGKIAQTEKERLKPSTFNTYADLISGMFKYANQEELVPANHFQNLRVPKQAHIERKPFTDHELSLFFGTDLYLKKDFKVKWSWRYWVPIIMFYTGCRVEEVCQLFLDDILEKDNVLCFYIRARRDERTGEKISSIKNKQSERHIPVHPILKQVGLLKYVGYLKDMKEDQLFPSLTNKTSNGTHKPRHTSVSKWFNETCQKNHKTSYIAKAGITDPTKVLYCFRHTVETCLINHPEKIEHDKIDTLLGHTVKSIGRLHYGTYNSETLLDVVSKIEYSDANLAWNKSSRYNSIPFPWEK